MVDVRHDAKVAEALDRDRCNAPLQLGWVFRSRRLSRDCWYWPFCGGCGDCGCQAWCGSVCPPYLRGCLCSQSITLSVSSCNPSETSWPARGRRSAQGRGGTQQLPAWLHGVRCARRSRGKPVARGLSGSAIGRGVGGGGVWLAETSKMLAWGWDVEIELVG